MLGAFFFDGNETILHVCLQKIVGRTSRSVVEIRNHLKNGLEHSQSLLRALFLDMSSLWPQMITPQLQLRH